jgi:hypothetical protein
MRLTRLDRLLAVCFAVAVIWFARAGERVAFGIGCDGKCRERQYFAYNVGGGGLRCIKFLKTDFLNCTSAGSLCLIQKTDPNPAGMCTPNKTITNKVGGGLGGCANSCNVPPGSTGESAPFTFSAPNTTQWNECPPPPPQP